MTNHPHEKRPLTNEELACGVKYLRKIKGWTQETLAELSRLSLRTIERVEKGEPSSPETRRTIASAFGYNDMNFFNAFPEAELQKILKETIEVPLKRVKRGKELREYVEMSFAICYQEMAELPEQIGVLFAEMSEFISDYMWYLDEYSETDKLGVNAYFQSTLDKLEAMEFLIGVVYTCKQKHTFICIGSEHSFPLKIRVPKEIEYTY